MVSDNPTHAAQARWLMLALLLCLGGCAAWQFHESRRPLGSYQATTGVIQPASQRLSTGKHPAWYTRFTLVGQPAPFWVDSDTPALLAALRQAQVQRAIATIYHNEGDSRAYQVEVAGDAIYSLDEGQRHAVGTFVWCLLVLTVTLPITLKSYLDYRASLRDDES